MNDLSDLYQEIIMDHRRNPRNEGLPADHTHTADGFNPFCGDKVSVAVKIEDGSIIDVGFSGEGCAISMASASLMTEAVSGKSIDDATASFEAFRKLLTDGDTSGGVDLGDLEALAGVRAYPTRIKCAILSWHTFKSALENDSAPVTTE
ncbi:MAG: SUF system NifU family Fe-S cluster assembly protein [Chloroflexi bacterium]|nr:SUF system NifU family Fe-S cluster assembly protein [Chloroflexota bacterium]